MLFDLEDYMNGGMVNRLDFIPEKSIVNCFDEVDDLKTTARATKEALLYSCRNYFNKAVLDLPLDKKPLAAQQMVNFLDAYREQAVKGIPFWNMFGSFKVKKMEGGYRFQDGDRYFVTNINEYSPSYDKNKSSIYTSGSEKGVISEVAKYYNRNGQQFGYNDGNKYRLLGKISSYIAILDAIEGNRTYQSYDSSISNDYYTACQNMMNSLKELIIACEGYDNNLQ
jgi:hypothetical protein